MTVMTSLGFLKTTRRDIPTTVGAKGLGEGTREEVSRKPSETSSSTGGPMWVKPAARGRNAGPTAEMTLVERRVTTVMSAGITLFSLYYIILHEFFPKINLKIFKHSPISLKCTPFSVLQNFFELL